MNLFAVSEYAGGTTPYTGFDLWTFLLAGFVLILVGVSLYRMRRGSD